MIIIQAFLTKDFICQLVCRLDIALRFASPRHMLCHEPFNRMNSRFVLGLFFGVVKCCLLFVFLCSLICNNELRHTMKQRERSDYKCHRKSTLLCEREN